MCYHYGYIETNGNELHTKWDEHILVYVILVKEVIIIYYSDEITHTATDYTYLESRHYRSLQCGIPQTLHRVFGSVV
jgi:hypothetical protein